MHRVRGFKLCKRIQHRETRFTRPNRRACSQANIVGLRFGDYGAKEMLGVVCLKV